MITPRDYQQNAVDKILWAMSLEGNDLVSLPTGSGKSVVIAEVANRLNQDILITQPSKEILKQNAERFSHYVPAHELAVCSASMSEKRVSKYTFGTIGTLINRVSWFKHIKLVLVDECHLINIKKESSMYLDFLREIGNPKVVGFTATPYRNVTGYHRITDDRGQYRGQLEAAVTLKLLNRMAAAKSKKKDSGPGFRWNRLLVNVNVADLIDAGYLCQMDYEKIKTVSAEEMKLNNAQTDFDLDDYEIKLGHRERQILDRILQAQREHKSVLVFCTSVKQAEKFSQVVSGSYCVSAKTPARRRDAIIDYFKSGRIKTVFNVGVLTTGFDHPALDCIVLIRPTRSVALYYQMLGRGVRTAQGKTTCKVIDFSGTVEMLGRVETIRLEKIEGKWELLTETGSWHNAPLYRYIIDLQKKKAQRKAREESERLIEPMQQFDFGF